MIAALEMLGLGSGKFASFVDFPRYSFFITQLEMKFVGITKRFFFIKKLKI